MPRPVTITNETGLATGTKVLTDEGAEIHGIEWMRLEFSPGELIKAEVSLLSLRVDTKAFAEFVMVHPISGERCEIAKITFADGSVVNFTEGQPWAS
jgi:hypothetical protein